MANPQPNQDALDFGPEGAPYGREFQFSDADFRSLVALARERTGISLSDSKRNLIYSRLSRRLRALGMMSFRSYREYLNSPDGEQEIESFINSISTNLTKFFRESHHFDHLRDRVALPFSQASSSRPGQRLRIWSAGCSTGEEPYTIAAVLRRGIPDVERHDVKILATDIDTDVLSKGANGEYPAASIDDIPENYRSLFQPKGSRGTALVIGGELKSLISFRHLNLMVHPWPMRGLFDAIFCRNVMIYFDGPTKAALIDRFVEQLKPGGWLYIGHSESLLGTHTHLSHAGRTIYRRNS
ncbi:CheR family methyltransferase [Rhodoplanes sp. Z2-YC6860]|uniref:CheR family methyltransferase n=1 Tax=Rhodoplanes sp. Z2-YC6860 TaxID=674703 RepID=UPI00078BD429|nr:protein-glutamate O-methyltransferase CheR [Rhodoplanes sp. Z2-YC6860]AMN45276.1 chemotaxis protein methyltransferase CheR [Rhodoplanes sp. Z2-YC6860]